MIFSPHSLALPRVARGQIRTLDQRVHSRKLKVRKKSHPDNLNNNPETLCAELQKDYPERPGAFWQRVRRCHLTESYSRAEKY